MVFLIIIFIHQQANGGTMKSKKFDGQITYSFLQSASQIDHGNIRDGNAESHSGEFSIEGRDDFSDGLGCSGGRRDDVGTSRAATAPVLVGRTVDGLLRRRRGVDSRHQALEDDEVVVDDLGQRCQAVGRARCVATGNHASTQFTLPVVEQYDLFLN